MRVREATIEDWPGVAPLLAELGRPDVQGTAGEEEYRKVFEDYLGRPDTVVLVAEDDGEIVGFLDMEFRVRLNFLPPQAWIPDMVVAESRRSEGVGRALISRAEEIARERGAWGMELESAIWREGAHRFYAREGWTDSGKSFSKNLSDQPWPPPPPGGGARKG